MPTGAIWTGSCEIVDGQATRELRRAVLRPHLGPGDALPGDDLAGGVHLAAFDDDAVGDRADPNRIIGTCFVYPEPCPWLPAAADAWRLRSMATDPQRQGRGVGRAVLAAAVDEVRGRGADLLWCLARESAAGFYERGGFLRHGPVYVEADAGNDQLPIPHVRMWRGLREPFTDPTSS